MLFHERRIRLISIPPSNKSSNNSFFKLKVKNKNLLILNSVNLTILGQVAKLISVDIYLLFGRCDFISILLQISSSSLRVCSKLLMTLPEDKYNQYKDDVIIAIQSLIITSVSENNQPALKVGFCIFNS